MKTKNNIWLIFLGILVAIACIIQSMDKPNFHRKDIYLSILHETEGKPSFTIIDPK